LREILHQVEDEGVVVIDYEDSSHAVIVL